MTFYQERLAGLGYVHQVDDPRLIRDDGNRNLYYLILASKVRAAKTIMDWVFQQPDAQGQSRFKLDFGGQGGGVRSTQPRPVVGPLPFSLLATRSNRARPIV